MSLLPLHIEYFATPLGDMVVGSAEKGVCLLEFVDTCRAEKKIKKINALYGLTAIEEGNADTQQTIREMQQYFAGNRKNFEVPLFTLGTPFQKTVWDALLTIPYGQSTYYQAMAEKIGRPTAMRALANANRQNKLSIIVPCHRVIGKDGGLTGYGGGLARKEWLLAHERKHA